MKKYIIPILLFMMFIPVFVNAETCDTDKISISSITVESKSDNVEELDEATANGKNINLNLSMSEVGDNIEYKIVVKNDSNEDYELDKNSLNLNSDYIDYTFESEDGSNIVKANSSKVVYLKVYYANEVPEDKFENGSYNDSKTMTVQLSNGETINVPNTFKNPNTGVQSYYLILFVILLISITAYVLLKKKKYTKFMILIIGTAIIIPMSVFALCKTEIKISSNIEIVEPKKSFLMAGTDGDETTNFLRTNIAKQDIESITFVDSLSGHAVNGTDCFDVSRDEDGSVLAWVTDTDSNNKYEMTIGADGTVYASSGFWLFSYLINLNSLNGMNNFDTSKVTNMSYMFYFTGISSTTFTLDLGDKFDTTKVTTMEGMFCGTGSSSTAFTLDLGDKFDTSNVTNMELMFCGTGESSTVFTLDLGDKFDTSNVTDMSAMFDSTGYNSTVFTIDLGDKFDTSNVTNMYGMFRETGYYSTVFTLDLGDKFDTSNVTGMSCMFYATGYSSTTFTLDLGDKFDTSKVTTMSYMFDRTGYNSAVFTLDLGDKFDTSNVTDMRNMFYEARKIKTIYAPSSFVTTSVTNSSSMFTGCESLVGGDGTTYNSSKVDKKYAHIDGGTSNPGYFTLRNN